MSDTKVVVELAGVNLPLGQFMELACKRMVVETAHETSKWEALNRLEAIVEAQDKEIKALKKNCLRLEISLDTLFEVMGGGRRRSTPTTPDNNTSTADEED